MFILGGSKLASSRGMERPDLSLLLRGRCLVAIEMIEGVLRRGREGNEALINSCYASGGRSIAAFVFASCDLIDLACNGEVQG